MDRLCITLTGTHRVPLILGSLVVFFLAACGPDYPNCDTDEDCKSGEFCINSVCQQCRSDSDCPEGQYCNGGACEMIAGYCTSSVDCPTGEECVNNQCVAVSDPVVPDPIEPQPDCSLQSVYFAFDSSMLESSARDQLANNASCIQERGIGAVHLTGMCDPRGTEEYNMALGDRRAQASAKYLKSLGVDADIGYSSMGEEMATGSDEESWARDRRVDLKAR